MSRSADPEAQRLAGEILVLNQKGRKSRTAAEDEERGAAEEARYAGLLQRFGDHEGSALSLVRAINKAQR